MLTLTQILKDKLIPWADDSAEKRLIVARPVMKKASLPTGVEIERKKIVGVRVITKDYRRYGNARAHNACWPTSHLSEIENFKLVCTLSGRTAYQINDYLLHAGEGFFLFQPPRTPHPDGTEPHLKNETGFCELLHIALYSGAIQCWLCRSENLEHFGYPSENYLVRDEQAVRLFQSLSEESIENNAADDLTCQLLLSAFFRILLRELLAGNYLRPSRKVVRETPPHGNDDFSATLREYIQTHLHQPLTIEIVARKMFLSRAQFARQVKRKTGKTFGEILTECRIEEAKFLLRESEWTASAIAEFVGLKSTTYFHNLFLRRTGSTPGRFRQPSRLK